MNKKNNNIVNINEQINTTQPYILKPEEKKIYDLLKKFRKHNSKIHNVVSPADMFMGALVVLENDRYENPEKIYQSAISLRRIIEPFTKELGKNPIKLNEIYWNLNKFVHVNNIDSKNFSLLKRKFMKEISNILQLQKSLYIKIDKSLNKKRKKIKEIRFFINKNFASRQYFYQKVTVSWLDFLTENDFLNFSKNDEILKNEQYIYHKPELSFLRNIVDKEPIKVTDIICNVEISEKKDNLELISQFWIIAQKLPMNQLSRIITKQKEEKWIQISGQCIFLDLIFKKLLKNKKYNELLILADDVLSFKEKTNQSNQTESEDNFLPNLQNRIFSLQSPQTTNVFDSLKKLPNEYDEEGLQILYEKLSYFFKLEPNNAENSVFEFKTNFTFNEINFFKFQANQHWSQSDEVTIFNICYTIIFLAKKLIKVAESSKAICIFDKYFKTLPKSSVSWRLQLFILSLQPKIFAKYLKKYFSKLFEQIEAEKEFIELVAGAEYKTTLKKTFEKLDEVFKREFVKKIFFYYEKTKEKKLDFLQLNTKHFSEILSSICSSLTEDEKNKYEQVFSKKCDFDFVPYAIIEWIQRDNRRPKSISEDELSKLTVPEIVKKLKTIWKPNKPSTWFPEKNDHGIFVNDVVDKIKKDMLLRLDQYLDWANLFFQREEIDPIYTNMFLLTCGKAIDEKNINLENCNFVNLIQIMNNIGKSDKEKSLYIEKEKFSQNSVSMDWNYVRTSMGYVLECLLKQKKEKKFLFDAYEYRFEILEIIDYLIFFSQIKNKPIELDELLNETFNTTTGWGFESLKHLIIQASSQKWSTKNNKFVNKIKILMERFIEEKKNTQLMFLFGYYINFFDWLDNDWLYNIWSKIFFLNSCEKDELYMPAWFGYLSGKRLSSRFLDSKIQSLYLGWIKMDKKSLDEKNLLNINSKVAERFAWHFLCSDKFNFSHPLFKEFYTKQNVNLQSLFIKFIGLHFIPLIRTDVVDYFKKYPQKKVLFKELWDKTLDNKIQDKRVHAAFGYWIHTKFFSSEYLVDRIKKTLEKTEGFLEMDTYLKKTICELAEKKPNETIEIIDLYLISGAQVKKNKIDFFDVENYWEKCFEILCKKKDFKKSACVTIDVLVRKRGSCFNKLMKFCKN